MQEQEQEQEPVKIRRASKGKKKVYEYFQPKRTDWYIKQVLLAFGFEYRSHEGISMSEIEAIAGSGIGGRLSKTIFSVIFKTERAEVFHLLLQNLFHYFDPSAKYTRTREEIIPMDNIRQRIMHHMIIAAILQFTLRRL